MDHGNAAANRWAVDPLELSGSDRLIDVGCGPGVAPRYAATRSPARAVGIDPAAVMIDYATAADDIDREAGSVEFKIGSAENIPYPDRAFTAAAAVNSAMLWDPPQAGFSEVRRVLVPGGRLVVALRERNEEASRFSPARFAGVPSDDLEAVFCAMTPAGFVDLVRHHAPFDCERYVAVVAAGPPGAPSSA